MLILTKGCGHVGVPVANVLSQGSWGRGGVRGAGQTERQNVRGGNGGSICNKQLSRVQQCGEEKTIARVSCAVHGRQTQVTLGPKG